MFALSPQMINITLSLVEEAIALEPKIAESLKTLLTKEDATPADWAAEKAALAQTYKDLVPNTQLPDSETTQ